RRFSRGSGDLRRARGAARDLLRGIHGCGVRRAPRRAAAGGVWRSAGGVAAWRVTVREVFYRGWERLSGPWVRRRQRRRARSLIIAGNAALTRDNDLGACSSYEESLALARRAGDRPATAAALLGLGWVALQQRNPAAARTFLGKSLVVGRDVGDEVRRGAAT